MKPQPQPITDTAPVRHGEELDAAALAAWLRGRLPGVAGEIAIEQFPGGHSNLTYLLRAGGQEYVLRRPPFGPVAPKAHDMAREYAVLHRVHPLFPPAPRVFLLCEDPAVIGATFFIMERRRGVVLRREPPAPFAAMPDFPQRAGAAFIETLAALHAINVHDTGLVALGKPEGFLERQVGGWSDRWQHAKTEELPAMDDVARWLAERMPVSGAPAMIHNDYKLDNVMLDAADPGRVVGVFDWEMATIGDPLADLGLVLCYWAEAGDPLWRREAISPLTTTPGWFTRAELVERYARLTGRDVSRIGWYEVLGLFKLAVILQQIYFRYRRGQTHDERFHDFDKRVRALAGIALDVARKVRA